LLGGVEDPAGPAGARFCFSVDEGLEVLPDPAEPLVLLPAEEPLVAPLPALLSGPSPQPASVAARAKAKAKARVFFMRWVSFENPTICNKRAGPWRLIFQAQRRRQRRAVSCKPITSSP
jgi:hypothetical protein